MRALLYLACVALVVGVAYWAYTENYTTQASNERVADLQQQIATEREAISILRAEWAYLNRPERLRDLTDLNFESLRLVPLAAQHFADLQEIPLPPRLIDLPQAPVDVSNQHEEGL